MWEHVAVSTRRAALGFAIGAGSGLLLGLLTGTFRRAETLLDTTLQMVRNIPPLALIPLVILWFGIDETAKLFLVSLGVFFPLYLNTFHGIRSVDKGLIEMAGSYGLRGWQLYRHVILPGALPSILVGVRFSLGLMWVLLIVAETISAQAGIGYMTMNAREFLQTDVMLVGIAVCPARQARRPGAKGLERWWLRWHRATNLRPRPEGDPMSLATTTALREGTGHAVAGLVGQRRRPPPRQPASTSGRHRAVDARPGQILWRARRAPGRGPRHRARRVRRHRRSQRLRQEHAAASGGRA